MSSPHAGIARIALPVPLLQLFDYRSNELSVTDIGRCVRVPFGRSEKTGIIVAIATDSAITSTKLKSVLHIQRDIPPLPADWMTLLQFAARYYHATLGELIALALPPVLRQSKLLQSPLLHPEIHLSDAGEEALQQHKRSSKALRLLHTIKALPSPPAEAQLRQLDSEKALTEAIRRGWLIRRKSTASPTLTTESTISLTAAQKNAVDQILGQTGRFSPWLLHGVTGSGKTEVYLRAAAAVLQQGYQVLMLVPEIALTPQFEERVHLFFNQVNIVSLHSGQSAKRRADGFIQALNGEAQLILGTRLAIFTPIPRLGMIVVDEEHDASYKQQEGVRYSARDLAVWRAHQAQVPVILGSATPSLESWQQVQQQKYAYLHLAERAVSRLMPTVRCIDIRHQRCEEGLSPVLLTAIQQRLARNEQSLVFLNRRGYAPVLSCTACGWISGCHHCSANLVVHLQDQKLRCHHCGAQQHIPALCPVCGNQDIHTFGRGTQKLEAFLQDTFPAAKVLRLDRDSIRSQRHWNALLSAITAGEFDILIGTQLIAKGHNFPKLTLVGVLGADAALHAADFRAPERLFQQLMQVGGRAGRAQLPGEVIIQTIFPDNPLFKDICDHDFNAFAARSLTQRQAAGFPPFTSQAVLRADAPQLTIALDFLKAAQQQAYAMANPTISVYDIVPMRLTRLARRERAQMLVEAKQRQALQRFLHAWTMQLRAMSTHHTLRWHIDVDPLEV